MARYLGSRYIELHDSEVALGDFQVITIDLGDGDRSTVGKRTDLDWLMGSSAGRL
jgi:hypothetical protein